VPAIANRAHANDPSSSKEAIAPCPIALDDTAPNA